MVETHCSNFRIIAAFFHVSEYLVVLRYISAVTEAGKVGGQLAKDFFKEEYMLNSKIGKYSMRQLIN